MQFQIEKDLLINPLQFVNGAVEKRQTLPVLGNVLLSVENKTLLIIGTDLELELRAKIQLIDDNVQDGDITVPAKKLLDICKSLPDDNPIHLSVSNSKLYIKSGANKFNLSTIAATEFPNVEEGATLVEACLPQSCLRQIIEKAAFAMAQNDVRYYLNGMLLEIESKRITAVATDGHRLAMSQIALEEELANDDNTRQAIIPRKGIMELLKLVRDEETAVTVSLGTNHLKAKVGDLEFITKLIDGKFPDYNRVIPHNNDKFLKANRLEFKEALSRASILCNEKFKGVRLLVNGESAHIQANNPEQEEADIELTIDYQGPEMEVGFNVSYLVDVLNSVDDAEVALRFADANSSLLVEETNLTHSVFVIMPMRL
jgi:DNA polymerase III subunit beta